MTDSCPGTCIYRVACTQNVYLDPTWPAPFYSEAAQGGNFSVDTAVLDKYVNVYPLVTGA